MPEMPIRMPKMSMTMEEGEFNNWLISVGDTVTKGQPVAIVMTDKVEMEVESEVEGRAAFRRLREERSDDEGWAELVSLGDNGGRTVLAWFGRSDHRRNTELKRGPLRLVVNRHHPASHPARSHLRLPST